MTRQPFRHFVSDEDQQTYRKWMRSLAFLYCSILVLAVGAASFRAHQNSDAVKTASQSLSVASHQFDR